VVAIGMIKRKGGQWHRISNSFYRKPEIALT
jgi:hypothetical protein